MIERYVPAISTYAKDVDNLIFLVGLLVGFWFFLSFGVFFWLIFKFRHKEGRKAIYLEGTEKKATRFITIPHFLVLLCDLVIIFFAIKVWYEIKQYQPPAEATVRIVSQQWAWTFLHPGKDGKLDTQDDVFTADELHVVANKNYHFELISKDVMHSFSVPVFRLKQDAVPGRVIKGWFNATKTGVHDIQCTEMCGLGHGIMAARIVIETPEQHAAWLDKMTPVSAAGQMTPPPAPPTTPPSPMPEGNTPQGLTPPPPTSTPQGAPVTEGAQPPATPSPPSPPAPTTTPPSPGSPPQGATPPQAPAPAQ